jgi:glycosyltransferase involved in cell wall biosynthesis
MRVAVVTVVHDPRDARVRAREIEALLRHGHEVTFVAPFTATGAPLDDWLKCVDVPRARGLKRRGPIRVAAQWMRDHADEMDVLLVHDPELVPPLLSLPKSTRAVRVWDVHENNPAAVAGRPYVPGVLRPLVRAWLRRLESRANAGLKLILAEESYQERFSKPHPLVLNVPWVNADLTPAMQPARRVVYVGSITKARGAGVLVHLARELQSDGIEVHLVGPLDDAFSNEVVKAAQADGLLHCHGRMPNADALAIVRDSVAGLSLLQDTPNHHGSMPTKVLEYLAQAVPVVSTALPLAQAIVKQADAGIVIPCGTDDAEVGAAAAAAVRRIAADDPSRQAMGTRGHQLMRERYDWNTHGAAFVQTLTGWQDGTHRAG